MHKLACLLVACALLTGTATATHAGILVTTDSGNVGAFTFTNTGILGSTATILVGIPGVLTSQMNTVNGIAIVPEPVFANVPFNLLVTPTVPGQYSLSISPNTAVKTIGGTVGAQAKLPFTLTRGDTPDVLPNFFNASGAVTGVTANLNPTYDFSPFAGGGTINFTFTATNFSGTSSFAGLFSTVGASAIGNGSFSQNAVPAPPSAVLAAIGMASAAAAQAIKRRLTRSL